MRLYYSISGSSYSVTGSYGGTTQTLTTVSTGLSIGDPFHILMKMSLTSMASNINNARGSLGAPGVYESATANLAVPTAIKFDSTTRFFFCTDSNRVAHAYCEIIGLATWYVFETASNGMAYFAGLYRKRSHQILSLIFSQAIPVAFYEFNQGSGTTVPDSYNNLGPASLGTCYWSTLP